MKVLLIALIALSVVCCSNKNNSCTEDERKVKECLLIYDPVCAIQKTVTGGYVRISYYNRCFACAEDSTQFIVRGQCEYYPLNAAFCDPKKSGNQVCTKIYEPVCGYFDETIQCFAPPCAMDFSNSCVACSHSNISFVMPGKCPRL